MFGGLFKSKKNAKRLAGDISYKDAKKIARDKNPAVRSELAERDDVKPEILYFMAEDNAPEVRRKVAANSATPRHADFILASDADDDVRCDLALKIGRLIPGLPPEESERLQDLAFEILNILAQDQLPRVRAIIAEEIKLATNVPKPMIERLAHDVELGGGGADFGILAAAYRFRPVGNHPGGRRRWRFKRRVAASGGQRQGCWRDRRRQ